MQYLLTFRSLTYAQRGARVLERAGVTGTLSRLPKSVSTRGCAYCVIVSARNRERAVNLLTAAGLAPERVIQRDENGVLEVGHDLS
ncbi:MAG: DUF3343 domain-containing protein [Oscillospiraceae bacterium]|nr:DUF3343 domain-containing protein [Oscillospiraceae bacterium]